MMKHIFARQLAASVALAAPVLLAANPARATLPADTGIAWNLSATDIQRLCKEQLATTRARVKQIEVQTKATATTATFAEGLGAIESVIADAQDALAVPQLLSETGVAKDVRDASRACNDDFSALGNELSADPAILRLAETGAAKADNDVDRALARHYVEEGRRAGAALDPAKRKQVTALLNQLNQLQTAYAAALGEDHSTIEISAAEAAPLPADFVATLKKKGTGYVVGVGEGSRMLFMRNQTQGAARQRYMFAFNRRGGEANVRRLAQASALRDRLARLLGFRSWDAYKLDTRMAKTPERALALLSEVDAALLPKARDEIAVLAELKRAAGEPTPFVSWDYVYYENQLEKTRYAVDGEVVRRYFPIPKVIAAVLDIYQRLLGVRFRPIEPAVAWAPGVLEYAITNAADDRDIGWFYLDLYPRPGKFTHFETAPIRQGRRLADGSYQRPVATIIGNWPVGEPGKPSLLAHDDVVTFFHEFGHLMHNTLSTVPYETLFGANVRLDFAEAPSQMLENWIWDPQVLKEVSAEVDTGAPIPDDLIQKMIAARHVADAHLYTGQAFLATYDLKLHDAGPRPDPTRLWFDLAGRMTTFPATPGTYPEASFGHLMGGYDAGYYGYLWSEVFSLDMFSEFQKAGLENPEVGMRYRRTILEPGATVEPDELLRNFLGRPVSTGPFYRYLNITPPKE